MPSARWISLPELRLSLRLLRKQPLTTLTTVLALTVGIGVTTTGFTLLDSVLFSKLPFPNGDRFVLLEVYSELDGQRASLDRERLRFFNENASTLEHVGAFRGTDVNLLLPSGELVPVAGTTLTPDSVRVFPYAPILGRMLRAEDGVRGAPPVVLIRESLWRRLFSADPAAVGSIVTMSGVKRTIVGVMPDAFRFPGSDEVWLPLEEATTSRGSLRTFGVLRAGVEPAAATAQVAALSKQFEAASPAAPRLRIQVLRFTEAVSRGLELLSFMLVTCLVLVLVVIAANVSTLVLARTSARSKELAIRTALGATRGRLIAQIFTEVLLLGAVAAAIGLTASQATLVWVRRTLTDMPFWVDFTLSPRTMAFVACATLLAAGVGGALPALKATRRDLGDVLAAGGRGTSTGFGLVGGGMVAVQVALSIALLNGALVMARGVAGYMSPAVLVPTSEVLTARVWTERSNAAAAIAEAIAAIPGVMSAGAGTSLPGLSPAARMTAIQDVAGEAPRVVQPAPVVAVQSAFFETLGATAQAGRLFVPGDFAEEAPPVAIVNEPFVRKFLGGVNPIGRRLRTIPSGADAPEEPWREIVGVVPDLGLSAGDETLAAGFYVPLRSDQLFHVALRTSGDARRLAAPLRMAVSRIDPEIQLRDVILLQDVGREDRVVFAGIGAALGALGLMGLALTVIGTYAILSLSVTRRTREIGIRTALGASRRQVLRAIMGRTCVPPALGAVAGIALGQAFVAARGVFAFRLPESSGPWGLPLIGVLMIAAGVLSAWVPARRALAVAPADAFRAE